MSTRAEKRREMKAMTKAIDYIASKFKDPVKYRQAESPGIPAYREGKRFRPAMTPAQLEQRAKMRAHYRRKMATKQV